MYIGLAVIDKREWLVMYVEIEVLKIKINTWY
jgi:hypothetical protein